MTKDSRKNDRTQLRTNKERVIIAFFIGVVLSICISLFGLHLIAESVKELIIGFVLVVSILSILFFLVTLYKEWVFEKLFGISKGDINDVKNSSTELISNLVKKDWDKAEQNIDEAFSKASAWYIWLSYRRWVIFVFYSLFIGFAGLLGSVLVFNQNKLISSQNEIIERQDTLLQEQNSLIETQTLALTAIEKRSTYLAQLNNVVNSVDNEIKSDYNSNNIRDLSPELIGRISALTYLFKPYRSIEEDTLSQRISLERGQLLILLVNSKLSIDTYDEIYSKSDFSYSELINSNLNNGYFKNARLNNSRFEQAYLNGSDFSLAELSNANFTRSSNQYTDFRGAQLGDSDFREALISGANFNNSVLDNTDFRKAEIRESLFQNLKSSINIRSDNPELFE